MVRNAFNEVFSLNSLVSWMGVSIGSVIMIPWLKHNTFNLLKNEQDELAYLTSTLLNMRIAYGAGMYVAEKTKDFECTLFGYNCIFNTALFSTILVAPTALDITNNIILPIYEKVIDYTNFTVNLAGATNDME